MPERLAEMVLDGLGESATLPLEIERIIKLYGIKLENAPLTKTIGGIYCPLLGCPVIIINSLLDVRRRRFTLAHELFHHLDYAIAPIKRASRFCMPDRSTERSANAFAGALLMPPSAVAFLSRTKSRTDLCDIFGVSRSALEIRLRELGLNCDISA